ncbi:MAG: N-acetylmuramoyl-L-alanine amidase [Abditibacteriales bacterium]|nr:N-acetylmuramoyl-L-alanine amidase [Abditibacteriales bacterium]MDW8366231.1 N-acetylmuramoyl-L-alanine amidase [Abditibacteriales bacterium]
MRLQRPPRKYLVRRWAAVIVLGAVVALMEMRTPLLSQNAQKTKPKVAPTTQKPAVLLVRCPDASAKVFVDGQAKGKTPALLSFQGSKRINLSVQAEGFQPYTAQVAVQAGKWKAINVKLIPQKSAALQRSNVPTSQPSNVPTGKVVCIDPGHPSEVHAGSTVQHGTTENHINWVVALKLKGLLEREGLKVVLTKNTEGEFVKNRRRAEIANNAGAELMVRLHCDHSAAGRGSGFTLYYPDRAGKSKDGDVGPSPSVCQKSEQAARILHESMASHLKGSLKDNGVKTDRQTAVGSRQGALTGSIYSRVPVVTVEMVFLSNKKDAEFIKTEEGQQKMAQALADGIVRFVNPKPSTAQR